MKNDFNFIGPYYELYMAFESLYDKYLREREKNNFLFNLLNEYPLDIKKVKLYLKENCSNESSR